MFVYLFLTSLLIESKVKETFKNKIILWAFLSLQRQSSCISFLECFFYCALVSVHVCRSVRNLQ